MLIIAREQIDPRNVIARNHALDFIQGLAMGSNGVIFGSRLWDSSHTAWRSASPDCAPRVRRRERAMQRFRSMKTLQKFSSVHAQVHNHFNQERHLVTRQVYKQRRSAALAQWSALAA